MDAQFALLIKTFCQQIKTDGAQAVPITAVATGVSDPQTVSTANVFQSENATQSFAIGVTSTFTGTTAYSRLAATNPPPTAVYYEVDGGSAWTAAQPTSISGANPAGFSVTLPPQAVGLHTLYYYAVYGDEGSVSSGSGLNASPVSGNVTGYLFQIDPPE